GEPIQARPPGVLERAARRLKRREVVWAGVAALVTACLCLALAPAFLSSSPRPADTRPGAPTDRKTTASPDPGRRAGHQTVTSGAEVQGAKTPGQDLSALPPDLALVPPEAFGFVFIDVAALRKSPAGQGLFDRAAREVAEILLPLEQSLGVAPGRLERAVLFVARGEKDGAVADPVVIVTTANPYRRERVLRAVLPSHGEKQAAGVAYYVGQRRPEASQPGQPFPADWALHFVNERTFVLGPEAEVRRLVSRPPAAGAQGPWATALQLARRKNLVVAGVYPPGFLVKWLRRDLVEEAPSLRTRLGC